MTPQEMRAIFFESATELLQQLNDEALRLEINPHDQDTIRSIRRVVHTLKGDSAVLGFRELSNLAHELEDALGPEAPHNDNLAEVALAAADMFDAMLAAYRGEIEPPNGDPVRALILKSAPPAPRTATPAAAGTPGFAWSEPGRSAMAEALARGMNVFNVALRFSADRPMRQVGAEMVRTAMRDGGEILACAPDPQQWDEAENIEAALATRCDEETLSAKLSIPGVAANLVVQRYSVSADETPSTTPHLRVPEDNVVRVDAAKLDTVLDLVAELVIGKSMLQQALQDFARQHPKDPLRSRLADALAFQAQTLRSLQRSAMSIRMVPVDQLFRRFPRMVRDVARQCGKQVVLETSGQETELDKALIDALAEPLSHLVRNAVDHGIESPAERQAAAKPTMGVIRLQACHQGNHIVIEVSDDGRGIHSETILRRAVHSALITPEQAARLEPDEIVALIFHPGFSTAEKVTTVSGRGVGMDVVKTAVGQLKGTVAVETTPGTGTTIRLKLPLTLAIVRSMLFRIDDALYAVPLDTVVEIRRAQEREFTRAGSHEVFRVRDELITVVRLAPPAPGKSSIVVLALGARRYGLVVDALVGEQELVIKPVDDEVVASRLVTGASVLGDGQVALVLNVEEAVGRYATTAPPSAWGATA